MKTLEDAIAALDSTGLPVATFEWPDHKAPPLPYVVLVPHGSRDDRADNRVVVRRRSYDAELYTYQYERDLCKQIGEALDEHGIIHVISETAKDELSGYAVTYFNMTLQE